MIFSIKDVEHTVKMVKTQYLFLTEALLVVIALVTGYILNARGDFDYMPAHINTYSVKPVYDYKSGLPVDVDADTLFPSGGADSAALSAYKGLTAVQVLKYTLGCYGNYITPDDAFLGRTAQQKYEDLTQAQVYAAGYLPISTCMCIDSMYALSRKRESADTTAASTAKGHIDTKLGATNAAAVEVSAAGLDTFADYIYTANMVAFNVDDTMLATEAKQKEYILNTTLSCVRYGKPQYTEHYDGMVSVKRFILIAQAFILLGALTMWGAAGSRNAAPSGDFVDPNKNKEYYYGLTVIVVKIVLFIASIVFLSQIAADDQHTVHDNTKYTGFRAEGYTTDYFLVNCMYIICWVMFVVNAAIFAIEVYSIGLISSNSKGMVLDWLHKREAASQIAVRVVVDLTVIVGFTLFGICVLLQAGVKNTTSVATGAFILFTIGVLQHFSNVLKVLFTEMCKRTENTLLMTLSTFEDNKNVDTDVARTANEKRMRARAVLQFFGYTRLLLFGAILGGTVLFLTSARDSVVANTMVNMMNGQLLYFVMAYFWSNVGFDVLAELIPYMHEKMSTDAVRQLVMVAYICFYNVYVIYYADHMQLNGNNNSHHPPLNACKADMTC